MDGLPSLTSLPSYSNTLLATLNSRLDSRSGGFESHSLSAMQRQTHSSRRNPQAFNLESGMEDSAVIQVQTVKHVHQDTDGSEVRGGSLA